MKISLLSAGFAALASTHLTPGVKGEGYELNADNCATIARQPSLALSDFILENENAYGPLIPWQIAGAPQDCLPAFPSYYGAWYKFNQPGPADMQFTIKAYTWEGDLQTHAVAVMSGTCGALTCVKNMASTVSLGQAHVDDVFTVTANTDYYILYTINTVPAPGFTQAVVPHIELIAGGPEAECQLHIAEDLLTVAFGTPDDLGLGSCTPCTSEPTTFPSSTGGAPVQGTTWTTTCTDPCQQCYAVTNPLQQGSGPFCYTASREWKKFTGGAIEFDDTKYCYTFADGNKVCDLGPKDGACPLEVNGVPCSSCLEDHSQTGCPFGQEEYGVFTADCSNIAGGGAVNKCQNTGFTGNPALRSYGIYTDIVAAANTPGQASSGLTAPRTQGSCTNIGSLQRLDPNAIPEETFAPTPEPDPVETLSLDSRTSKQSYTLGRTVQYRIDLSGKEGVLDCDTRAKSGDVDLYVALDASALEAPECFSVRFDSDELCDLVVLPGTQYASVNVNAFTAASDVEVKCRMKGAETLKVGVNKKESEVALPANKIKYYKLDAPANTARVSCKTDTDDGDLDLFMRLGEIPVPFDPDNYDCNSTSPGGDENCELVSTDGQDLSGQEIYILMYAFGNVTKGVLECQEVLENVAVTRDSAESIDRGKTKSRFDLLENQKRAFKVNVDSGSLQVWCDSVQHSNVGNLKLYTRVGDIPVLPGAGNAPNDGTQCSDGPTQDKTHCQYNWDNGNSPNTQFYAVVEGQDGAPVVGVDMKCNFIKQFRQSDAEKISDKKSFNDLVKSQEIGYYWEIQEHTGEIKCTLGSKSGNMHIYGERGQWPSSTGGSSLDCNDGSECRFTYGGDGSSRERFNILIKADNDVHGGEVRCTARPSEPYKQNLQNQGGDALQNFLDQFRTGA